ncbi:hypothetical protein PCASD_13878 [Puccinia coronata f. sp. avenae]|uniref:Uncharacterized protein n=1 Tax=Puccinia coronata f. sp. avenae TaxID=200324 RepID=A0A2N5U857_9BASI|nr:hypothetical protein PCASD_13878 [Puccinia coronata f. sp. avenae]
MAGQEMLKQPCSKSDLGQAPSNQSACWPFKRVCPIMLSCRSAEGGCRVRGASFLAARRPTPANQKKHSAAHQNGGNRRSKQKPNCKASSSASCRVIPGLSYIPLSHWPTSITRQFHPADRPGQRGAGDKRRFSTPNRTRTTWGQDLTVPPRAVLGSKGEIRTVANRKHKRAKSSHKDSEEI